MKCKVSNAQATACGTARAVASMVTLVLTDNPDHNSAVGISTCIPAGTRQSTNQHKGFKVTCCGLW